MMTIDQYIFEGHFAELSLRFIKYKQSIGYKYGARSIRAVRQMNEYLSSCTLERQANDFTLSQSDVLDYTARKLHENSRTQAMREATIRQFSLFLNSLGFVSYIVPAHKSEQSAFTPYIFTKQQICAVLDVADHLDYEYRSPNYHFVYPFLLRLLYCTGLRISEALTLKISSIDFDEHVLEIKQSKYNNSRLVPMSQSLFEALEKYMHQVGCEREETSPLFRSNRGNSYNASSILYQFKCILSKANISCTENGGLPRLHDLRHTFAVHSLDAVAAQGMDTYTAIPYLAAYMGHRKIKCSEQYLRLTSQSYEKIIEAMAPLYENLFPKVVSNEKA